MVFRKPYAFLIKHFKLIHLILSVLYIYLAIKTSSMLTYYNNFLSGTSSKLTAINYVNSYYMIAVVLSIIVCTIILILMQHKHKPKLLYIILIVLYILIAAIISLTMSGLNTIYLSVLDTKTTRLYRDLLQIILIVQYITIVLALIRGLGFDIKKFDFVKDLNEMNIELTDDEEVELTLDGTNIAERKIRRRIRELKYYYIENKSFINIVIVIIIVLLASTITINKEVINKVYSENEIFSTDDFNIQVLNTYLTNKTYNNQLINNPNYNFVIVKLQITPNGTDKVINTNNLILRVNNKTYNVNNKKKDKFTDLGNAYQKQKISKTKNYLFIYNIKAEDINKKMTLIYGENKKVTLNPINIDETQDTTNLKLTDTIDLSKTPLSSGTITINKYENASKYTYEYTYQIGDKTYTNTINIQSSANTILKLELTSSLPNNLSTYDIISNYGKIKYVVNGTEYTSTSISNKTPNGYSEGLYLEVDKEVETAEKVYLELNVRGQKYVYTLK